MTITTKLAEWALSLESLPADVRTVTISHLYDGFGDALGALRSGDSVPAHEVAGLYAAQEGESALLGTSNFVNAPMAALSLGALIHHLDFDDTHAGGLVHATSVSLPAALAIGNSVSASWDDVVTASTIGLETVSRIAMGSPHGFHARGIHATHACGTIAAALVSAKLMKLSREETINALGIAASASGGLLEFLNTGSSTKQLHPGTASMNGVVAALLAKFGATGPASAIEGKYGIYATLSARPADPQIVTKDLGKRWEATQITIKPYAACQLSHVSLDALRQAMQKVPDLHPNLIESIKVGVHPDSAAIVCEPRMEKVAPRTPYDAKFSLQWSMAALIIDGDLTVDSYSMESITRPEVVQLANRVQVEIVGSAGTAADAAGEVAITLIDGIEVRGAVECSSGGPRKRFSKPDLVRKFAGNARCSIEAASAFYSLIENPNTSIASIVEDFRQLSKGL
jgi:2-methylcitrate dehydratase PrpD